MLSGSFAFLTASVPQISKENFDKAVTPKRYGRQEVCVRCHGRFQPTGSLNVPIVVDGKLRLTCRSRKIIRIRRKLLLVERRRCSPSFAHVRSDLAQLSLQLTLRAA